MLNPGSQEYVTLDPHAKGPRTGDLSPKVKIPGSSQKISANKVATEQSQTDMHTTQKHSLCQYGFAQQDFFMKPLQGSTCDQSPDGKHVETPPPE